MSFPVSVMFLFILSSQFPPRIVSTFCATLFRALFPSPPSITSDSRIAERSFFFNSRGDSFAHSAITRTYGRSWCTHVSLRPPTHVQPISRKRNADDARWRLDCGGGTPLIPEWIREKQRLEMRSRRGLESAAAANALL